MFLFPYFFLEIMFVTIKGKQTVQSFDIFVHCSITFLILWLGAVLPEVLFRGGLACPLVLHF